MVDPISGMLSICCGVFIILGVISVFLGGTGAILGGASEAYNRPKMFLYFLYFFSIFMAFYVFMEANGVFEPPDEDMETWFVFLGYSSGVLVFHVMDYYWQKLGLGDLLEPPKKRWAYGGCNIWFGMLMPVMWSQPFFSEFGFDEMAPIGKWGWGITIFLYGLAFVWWASTEAEKAEPPTSD